VIRSILAFLFLTSWLLAPLRAIESNGGYVTTTPTVANWSTGWPTSGKTGWDYVGQINGGASAVYLGNGWVLTARHVGSGVFSLRGVSYQPVTGSEHYFTTSTGTADLTLFQISTSPALNPLTLSQSAPVAFSDTPPGDETVMIGYGGGYGETWGEDSVTYVDQPVQPSGLSYISNDFLVFYGTYTLSTGSFTNTALLVGNDSGGGDFIYNTATHAWELAGINEVVGTGTLGTQSLTFSGMVQMNTYAAQINAIVNPPASDSPTLPLPALLALACLLLWTASRSLGKPARTLSRNQHC
jgi:hypothetical protein